MFINFTIKSGISISSYRHPECYYGNIVDMVRDIKNGYNSSCPLEGAMDTLEDASLWKDTDLEIIEDIYNSIIEYMYEQEEMEIHEPEVKLELRDYIAMEAMKALMPIYWDGMIDEFDSGEELVKCHVETAYEYADAMLKERKKKDEDSI